MKTVFKITTLLLIGVCYAEIALPSLPTTIPNLDDIPQIKEKCEKKGAGKDAYEKIKTTLNETKSCVEGIVDISKINSELEESKKTGSMDEVFGKYCSKRPQLEVCVNKLLDATKPCLDDSEKDALNITLHIVGQLGEFACYRNGDRIAMFVAEGGVDCLKEHTEGVQNCVNSTLNITQTSVTPNSLPFLIDTNKCSKMEQLQTCVVEELEKCKDSTPANIVDALFRFVYKSACKNKQKRSLTKRELSNALTSTAEHYKSNFFTTALGVCQNFGQKSSFSDLEKSVESATICMKNLKLFAIPKTEFELRVRACLGDLVQNMENCLPDDAKYYPSFLTDFFISISNFAYNNMDKIKFNSTNFEVINCFQIFKHDPDAKSEVKTCIEVVKGHETDQTKILKKEELCLKTSSLATCISDIIKTRCIKDIIVDKIRKELFDAVNKPCRTNN